MDEHSNIYSSGWILLACMGVFKSNEFFIAIILFKTVKVVKKMCHLYFPSFVFFGLPENIIDWITNQPCHCWNDPLCINKFNIVCTNYNTKRGLKKYTDLCLVNRPFIF